MVVSYRAFASFFEPKIAAKRLNQPNFAYTVGTRFFLSLNRRKPLVVAIVIDWHHGVIFACLETKTTRAVSET